MALGIKRVRAEITTLSTKDVIFTATAAETLTLNMHVFNGAAGVTKIKVWKVLNGETLGNEHRLGQDIELQPLESVSLSLGKQAMIVGDKIQCEVDGQPVNFVINYIEIT